ncbi:MAG: tryptophan-rich sensory protein [Ruminococcaceae bacterium]|nr:tryptophan-rich sensory protein [Oscillospiraceae bacterium]
MKKNWKTYALFVAITLFIGALSAFFSRNGMEGFQENVTQPPLSPPMILFPIVWTILYILMGIGAARVYLEGAESGKGRCLNLYVTQLVVNFFWSLIFFNARAFGLAFLWLLVLYALVIGMIVCFMKVDKWAGLLQIPYSLWLLFAGYLNLGIWLLN